MRNTIGVLYLMKLRNGWKIVERYVFKQGMCAMEKPVVATHVGSLPVVWRYVLVESRNPESITEGVEKVYKGEVDASSMRIFNCDECVRKYLGIYEEILK